MTTLLSAFEPFGQRTTNASLDTLERIAELLPSDSNVETMILPVIWNAAADQLIARAEQLNPTTIICLGEHGRASTVNVETIAFNTASTSATDNDDQRFSSDDHDTIIPGAPDTYPTTLPVDEIVNTLNQRGIDAQPSDDIGTYLCNHITYRLLHWLRIEQRTTAAGFIHIPLMDVEDRTTTTPDQLARAMVEVLTELS